MNLCMNVTCNMPPATTCASSTVRRTYASMGTCNEGLCDYPSADTTCPFGCANGMCAADLCQGVSCDMPPASGCLNNTTQRTYAPRGSCGAGSCGYSFVDTTCANGCSNGACLGPTCGATTCSTGPAASCTSATVLKTWAQTGSCDAGTCSYTSFNTNCSQGCFNGACIVGSWETASVAPVGGARLIYDGASKPHLLTCVSGDVVYRRLTAGGWVEELVDDNVSAGGECEADFAFDTTGELVAAWYDGANRDLRFGRRISGVWQKELVATTGDVGFGATVLISPSGAVQLLALSGNEARLFQKMGSSWTSEYVAPSAGGTFSAAYGLDGTLYVANGVNTMSTGSNANQPPIYLSIKRAGSWSRELVNSDGMLGRNGLSIGSDGVLRIAFRMIRTSQGNGVVRSYLPAGPVDVLATTFGGNLGEVPPLLRTTGRDGWTLIANSGPAWQRSVNGVWDSMSMTERPPFNAYAEVLDLALGPDGKAHYLTYDSIVTGPACVPNCTNAQCGDDGCGGTCGSCSGGSRCALNGVCTDWNIESLETGGYSSNVLSIAKGGGMNAFWTGGTRGFTAKRQSNGWWRASDVPTFFWAPLAASRADGAACVGDNFSGSRAVWCEDSAVDGGWSGTPPAAFSPSVIAMGSGTRVAALSTGANPAFGYPRWGTASVYSGGVWSPSNLLGTSDDTIVTPSGAMDTSDVLHALWLRKTDVADAGRMEYLVRELDGGESLTTVRTANFAASNPPLLRVDGNRTPHALVVDRDGLTYGFKSGAQWSFEPVISMGQRVLAPGPISSATFSFAVSPTGDAALFLNDTIYRRTGASQWSRETLPMRLQQSSGSIDFDATGRLHLIVLDQGRMLHLWR